MDPIVEIESLRERIMALQGEIKLLMRHDVLRPQPEASAHVQELVNRAAIQARVSLSTLLTESVSRLKKPGFDGALEMLNSRRPFDLLCLIVPDIVEQRLLTVLSDVYVGGDDVMSGEEQGQQLAQLREELFALELEEEQAICALEKTGRPAPPRRADVNPEVILHESTCGL
jgi:hypothetical protein